MRIEKDRVMTIRPVSVFGTNTYNRTQLHPAIKGAVVGATVSIASTGLSWLKNPEEFKQSVKEIGGKNKYVVSLIGSVALVSLFGAGINTLMHKFIENTVSKKQPKAVN